MCRRQLNGGCPVIENTLESRSERICAQLW